ncbi:unnamed protein product [Ectocarpus sp. 8 AP-2014]
MISTASDLYTLLILSVPMHLKQVVGLWIGQAAAVVGFRGPGMFYHLILRCTLYSRGSITRGYLTRGGSDVRGSKSVVTDSSRYSRVTLLYRDRALYSGVTPL